MAASIATETEQGTYVGFEHSHNGYYAGDYTQVPFHAVGPEAFRSA